MPPLRYILWCCFIKNLLQHDQAIVPVYELLDLAIVGLQMTASYQLRVKKECGK